MYKRHNRKSLSDYIEENRKVLRLHSAKTERREKNFDINVSFLRKYNLTNELELDDGILREMAHKFTLWENNYVHSFHSGYEEFREKVIWLDYDEILEMYIENTANPSVKPYWQSENNYSFFMDEILSQINGMI